MKQVLPPGMNAAQMDRALKAMAKVVGDDWVLATDLDRDTYLARVRSASYVAHSADPAFFDSLDPLFHDHQIEGYFPFDYDTVLFTWPGRLAA